MRTTIRIYKKWVCLLLWLCAPGAYVTAQLQAGFSATPLSGCAPMLVHFTDASTGTPNSWFWDLGNGTTSILQNPSVTYFNPGTYNIKLVVRNAAGNADSLVRDNYITVHARPVVSFTASDTFGCYPLPVQFTDLSTAGSGVISSWQWDFGDGGSSTQQNPFHEYQQGIFNVVLRVVNDKGCQTTITRLNYIRATEGVNANFSFVTPSTCNPPVTINFNNLSAGTGALTYQWNFGDGGTSTQQNPTYTYNTAGSYPVTLIATNNTGCTDTIVQNNAITVGATSASFTSADSICEGQPLVITNTSNPLPGSALWSFGDATTSTQINPVKIYNTPGTYTIRMLADFGGCQDSAFKTVTVLQKPQAAFTGTNTTSCQAPLTTQFNSTSTGATSYAWNFGDGGTAATANPSHTYTSPGQYDVTLVVTNALGCSDTTRRLQFVTIQPVELSLTGLPDSGCSPLTIHPQAIVTAIDGVASYNWTFGDGGTSTAASPSHIYTAAGVYTVQLIITTNGGCRDTVSSFVRVGDKPVANFIANPLDACAEETIQFTDQSTGNPVTYWYWQFGDGASAFVQNPSHAYNDTGWFSVTLIVGSNGCYDTLVRRNYIHINPPIARFVYDFDCAQPMIIRFTDNSVAPLTWSWNFGDGNTSTQQSPVHTYASPGTYTITLTVTNGSCSHTTTETIRIVDEHPDFRADQLQICRNTTVSFTSFGYTRSNIASYSWNFGDGAIVTGDSTIVHTYTVSGVYTVQLIMTDINNCRDTVTKLQYITVFGPRAAFTPAVPGACRNAAVTFNDQSSSDGIHPIQQWIWNYGDGTSDTLSGPPFTHTYNAPGTYIVTLKVRDTYGCSDSMALTTPLIISQPVAAFTAVDTLSCPNKPIQFTNASTGPALTYSWLFGDGNSFTHANPLHSYAADGFYTVQLAVTDQYGCTDTLVRPQYIHIESPRARFTVSDSAGTCPPMFVEFTNQSSFYTSLQWDFGDGSVSTQANPSHFYTSPGVFRAKLYITSPGGCIDSVEHIITVQGPSGQFTYMPLSGCSPLTIQFRASSRNTANYVWDFNNGQTISTTDSIVTYTYTQPGKYLPRLILQDAAGCSIPILGADSISVLGVELNISASSILVCDSGLVVFSSGFTGNDDVTGYEWNFGNGGTSTQANPSYYYTSSGQYHIQCIATTRQGCRDTAVLALPLAIVESPVINILGNPGNCVPATTQFNGQIIRNDTSALAWQWNFGNGQTSALMTPPPATYTTAGAYTVTSIATNSSGCADTATLVYNVWPLPNINAGADMQICRGTPGQLTATGGASYTWSPAVGLSCTSCATPLAAPDSTRLYLVNGMDANGCRNSDSVRVSVVQPFTMTQSPDNEFCKGKFVTLFAAGADSYRWSPATGLSATTGNSIVAKPDVTTTYTVVGYDRYNCFTDTGTIRITVFPIPAIDAGPDQTIVGGSEAQLNATSTATGLSYRWSPASTLSCFNCPNPVAKPNQTTTYTVEARNTAGCSTKDDVTVFVVCDKGNLFIPNTFSPNGDGMNDKLYPRGKGIYTIKSFRIFNRWGELMYEAINFGANDESKAWDGTYKGKSVTPDIYVYMIEVICDNSNVMGFKGNITLIK